jgi:hypothetical protein
MVNYKMGLTAKIFVTDSQILKGRPVPDLSRKSIPNADLVQNVRSSEIEQLALEKYQKNGSGITFVNLIESGLATSKSKAQAMLKYHSNRSLVLFTIPDKRTKPQQYYPSSLKAEIVTRTTPIRPTGVFYFDHEHNQDALCADTLLDPVRANTLIEYALPLLKDAPLHIHNIHFKLCLPTETYPALKADIVNGNKGKQWKIPVGYRSVKLSFYPSGSLEIVVVCSRHAFPLVSESHRTELNAFLGEVRGALSVILHDERHHIIPAISDWLVTQLDINRDVSISSCKVSDLQLNHSEQYRYYDNVFRVYLKPINDKLFYRFEKTVNPNKPYGETIAEAFTLEGLNKRLIALETSKGKEGMT